MDDMKIYMRAQESNEQENEAAHPIQIWTTLPSYISGEMLRAGFFNTGGTLYVVRREKVTNGVASNDYSRCTFERNDVSQ